MMLNQKINGVIALLFIACFSLGTGILVLNKIESDVQKIEERTYVYNLHIAEEIGERRAAKKLLQNVPPVDKK